MDWTGAGYFWLEHMGNITGARYKVEIHLERKKEYHEPDDERDPDLFP